jgi:hypothetical protein
MDLINIAVRLAGVKYDNALKKFKDLGVDLIEQASDKDPSGTDKYLDWILSQIEQKHDFEVVLEAVNVYNLNQNRLKDLGLGSSIDHFKDPESILNFEQLILEKRFQEYKSKISSDSEVVYPASGVSRFVVATMPTHKSAQENGVGTRWCITNPNGVSWNDYSKEGTFYVVYDVLEDSKYAVRVSPSGVLDVWGDQDQRITQKKFQDMLKDDRDGILSVLRVGTSSKSNEYEDKLYNENKDSDVDRALQLIDEKNWDALKYVDSKVLEALIRDSRADLYDQLMVMEYLDPDDIMKHVDLLKRLHTVDPVVAKLGIRHLSKLHKLGISAVDVNALTRLPKQKAFEYLTQVLNRGTDLYDLIDYKFVERDRKKIRDLIREFRKDPPDDLNDRGLASLIDFEAFEEAPEVETLRQRISDFAAYLNPEMAKRRNLGKTDHLFEKFLSAPLNDVIDFANKNQRQIPEHRARDVVGRVIREESPDKLVDILPLILGYWNLLEVGPVVGSLLDSASEKSIGLVLGTEMNSYDKIEPMYEKALRMAIEKGFDKALSEIPKAKLSDHNAQYLFRKYPGVPQIEKVYQAFHD